MMNRAMAALMFVGGALIFLGLWFGLKPYWVHETFKDPVTGGYVLTPGTQWHNCGSAWVTNPNNVGMYKPACASYLPSPWVPAVLLILGILVVGGAALAYLVVRSSRTQRHQ